MSDLRKNRLERQSLRVTPGRKRWMLAFLLASASVFFVILYVALPGATIAIEPSSDVVTKTLNVTMATTPREQEDIKAYVVESTVQVRLTHSSSGIENRGVNAKGTITVKNTSAEDRTLIAQTRFQTDAGLVFRIQKEVTVPGGSVEHPGTLDVMVVADAADANGAPVGDRGNIGPSHFFLPGLKEDSRNILYGESSAPMTGGTSEIVTHVTEEDLKAAQNEAEEELQKAALADLRKEVLTVGNREGLNLKLLEDTDTLTFGTPTITVPYAELGKEKSSFEITGSLQVSGIAYDSDALYSLLKTEIVSVQTPGKQLISVDRDSISLSVLEANAGSYKVTASIQGVEEYQINPDLEGGLELSEKIKEHVAGRSIEEAQAYVENLPEVNTVDISVWPMWSPALPSLPENIKIKSLSTGEALQ